jgi:hypothetical protein
MKNQKKAYLIPEGEGCAPSWWLVALFSWPGTFTPTDKTNRVFPTASVLAKLRPRVTE